MSQYVKEFTEEQRRVLLNLSLQYDAWISTTRALSNLPYGMKWAVRDNSEYLLELLDRVGNSKSRGPRSSETEKIYAEYTETKADLRSRFKMTEATLAETSRLYLFHRLPRLEVEAAKILRQADLRSLLGDALLVIGTNAMPAYHLEAGGWILNAPDTTADIDMTWKIDADPIGKSVLGMLKAVDKTYTVNTERSFQARNAKAYEFELLTVPSSVGIRKTSDPLRALPTEGQEWLSLGRPVSQVVVGSNGAPARIVAPDPRYFALHKLWLSSKADRDPNKKPKDKKQGMALLSVIKTAMPHYRLDDEFVSSLAPELKAQFDVWWTGYEGDESNAGPRSRFLPTL